MTRDWGVMNGLASKLLSSVLAAGLVFSFLHAPASASAASTPPVITKAIGGNKVGYIEWNQAPDTTNQKVIVYNLADAVVWDLQLSDTQTSFLLGPTESFTNGITYRAEVQALVNDQWISSTKTNFTPQASAPAGTTSTKVIDVQGFNQSAQVYFDKDASAIKYFVGAFPDSSTLNPSRMIEVSAADVKGALSPSGVFENSLINNNLYYFSILALNASGLGTWSPRTGVGTYAYVYPRDYLINPPTSVTATAGTMQATVQWTAPSFPSTTIRGYEVQYTTNAGSSWSYERFSGTSTSAVINLFEGATPTHFRVAALGQDGSGTQQRGAFSAASSPVSPNKRQQSLTWSPSSTSSDTLASGISMEPLAVTDADTLITYSVSNSGTAGCSISIIESLIEATSFGTCRIRVDAAGSPGYETAGFELVFSFVDPNAVQSSPDRESINGGGVISIGQEASAPNSSLIFSKAPNLLGSLKTGSLIKLTKFRVENPRRILKIKYNWYVCGVEIQSSAEIGSSCTRKPKSKGRSYAVKKSDLGSFIAVVIKAKTKNKSLKHLLSSKAPIENPL